ncbi:glycosyltransferase [Smaragdicoccus niigatensis]|nr:glycosyltransferase [Smaragdicoccus niigatensis]
MTDNQDTGIAVALVTHNGERFLPEQLASIDRQTVRPDVVFWVDDESTDATCDLVRKAFANSGIRLVELDAPTRSGGLFTRIARNFQTAISAAADYPFIALSDQDDVWVPTRLERQRDRLTRGALMTIADGHVIDEDSARTGTTMRHRFPVPLEWTGWASTERLEAVLRQPMATGAASMISNSLLELALPIPSGWLHDRWLSLVAAARAHLDVDQRQLIEYRVYDEQAVGVDGETHLVGWRRIRVAASRPFASARKLLDLRLRLRKVAVDAHLTQLRTREILRIYLTSFGFEATCPNSSCSSSVPTAVAYQRVPVGSAAACGCESD